MYTEFYQILLDMYKNDDFYFTEKFLVDECNRVGFNKIGCVVHYKYIYNALNNRVAYDSMVILPPRLG